MSDYSRLPSNTSDQYEVMVEEYAGMRLMSFDGDRLQSAMKLSRPHELALSYTQRIMSFLLFHPAPQKIVMVGLGGGSLAKFIHYEMTDTSTTIVEVDPRVLATARAHFFLPEDDERLQVIIADGSEYVATHSGCADILIVDGFDCNGQAPSLCTKSFYTNCFAALRPGGILVVNLFSYGKAMDVYFKRIRACFDGTMLKSLSSGDGNCIVFGFQDERIFFSDHQLIDRAEALKDRYGLPFPTFVQRMKYMHAMHRFPERNSQ